MIVAPLVSTEQLVVTPLSQLFGVIDQPISLTSRARSVILLVQLAHHFPCETDATLQLAVRQLQLARL